MNSNAEVRNAGAGIGRGAVNALAFASGAIAWFALRKGNFSLGGAWQLFSWCYDKVGVTILALIPLAAWGVWVALRYGKDDDITLAYIGTTSQRFGLLGTVIGIVDATLKIGVNMDSGSVNAVTSAMPAVGQALVSTGVGFVIAISCDFIRYMKRSPEAEASCGGGN
jgi:hypothetical protein